LKRVVNNARFLIPEAARTLKKTGQTSRRKKSRMPLLLASRGLAA